MINHGNRVQNRTIPVTMEASMSGIAFESLSGIRHFNGYRCQIEFFGWNLRHRMSLSKVEGRFEARGWHLLGGSSTKRYDRHVTTSSVLRTEQQLRVRGPIFDVTQGPPDYQGQQNQAGTVERR